MLAGIMFVSPTFAQEAHDQTGIKDAVEEVFEWIGDYFTVSISGSDVDAEDKEQFQGTLDSGISAGKQSVNLWFMVHEFVVNLIAMALSQAGFEVDRGVIGVVAIVITLAILGLLLFELYRKSVWVFFIVTAILVILAIIGISLEF